MSLAIGFVGAGQMATALALGLVKAGLTKGVDIVAFDPFPAARTNFESKVAGARTVDSTAPLASVDVLFLAVKPQQLAAAAGPLAGKIAPKTLVVSVLAGATLATLTSALSHTKVVRVMPNTPALVGQGASAYAASPAVTDADLALAQQLLSSVGFAAKVDEKLLDAVTGLSGSGPAYVCLMIEALADGGVRMGLPRDLSLKLAAQTLLGTAQMVLESGEHPAVLKDRVASPGGTTIAGLATLEERAVRGALIAAVEQATLRSQQLGAPPPAQPS